MNLLVPGTQTIANIQNVPTRGGVQRVCDFIQYLLNGPRYKQSWKLIQKNCGRSMNCKEPAVNLTSLGTLKGTNTFFMNLAGLFLATIDTVTSPCTIMERNRTMLPGVSVGLLESEFQIEEESSEVQISRCNDESQKPEFPLKKRRSQAYILYLHFLTNDKAC